MTASPSATPAGRAEHPGDGPGLRTALPFVSDRVTTVRSSTTIAEAATALHEADASLAVVMDDAGVQGVVSERDICRAVAAGLDVERSTVSMVETDDLIWMPPESLVEDIAELMVERHVRHVLVGDGLNELVGVVSIRDLLAAFLV